LAQRIRSRLTYANVVSTICLFVVLGGGAYAVTTLPEDSVGTRQIKPEAVRSGDISRRAVAPRAKVAERTSQLLLPNARADGRACGQNSKGSIIKLSVGAGCRLTKGPFRINFRCADEGSGVYRITASMKSAERWFVYDQERAAGEGVPLGDLADSGAASDTFMGPTLATPGGEGLVIGEATLGVNSIADCWAALVGAG
jgi:hypothetical protein